MKRTIISRGEALQILKNDLRAAALREHAAELAKATAEERQRIMATIDAEVKARLHLKKAEPDILVH